MIGFEPSRIEHDDLFLSQNELMNNSDNYVEYIERLLENINLEENNQSIQQALHIANQNFNLDDDQTQILGSILHEITTHKHNNQEKSLSGCFNVLHSLTNKKTQ